jgi:hypothetical protein
MGDTKASAEQRGRRAAVKAFLGMVAVGAAYAAFNYRISEPDERRGRRPRRRR